jgi:hypothetical protein
MGRGIHVDAERLNERSSCGLELRFIDNIKPSMYSIIYITHSPRPSDVRCTFIQEMCIGTRELRRVMRSTRHCRDAAAAAAHAAVAEAGPLQSLQRLEVHP